MKTLKNRYSLVGKNCFGQEVILAQVQSKREAKVMQAALRTITYQHETPCIVAITH